MSGDLFPDFCYHSILPEHHGLAFGRYPDAGAFEHPAFEDLQG
jgi:hypothetical protein